MDEYTDDGKVWAYYNITNTSATTEILHSTGNVSGMEVDGVSQTVSRYYQFNTTGEHLVKFSLTNNAFVRYDYPPNVSDDGMFRDVTALTKVYLPSTVLRLSHTFRGCSNLTEIHVGSLRCVGNWGFSNCPNLTGDLSLPNLDGSQTGDDQYPTIGRHSFDSAGYSRIVNLGNVVYLGGSGDGEGCFANMPNLTYVALPATLEKYDSHIFHNCPNLTTVILKSTIPPVPTSSDAKFFGYQPAANCKIYVPKGTVNAYKAANGWSRYASMIEEYPYTGFVYLGSSLLGYAEVEKITFTFFYTDGNSIEISIPPNMTWEEFIESGYNGIYVEDWGFTITFHEDENAEGYIAVNDEQGDPAVVDSTSGGESPEEGDRPLLSTVINDGDYYMAADYEDPGGDPGSGDDGGDGGDGGSGDGGDQ